MLDLDSAEARSYAVWRAMRPTNARIEPDGSAVLDIPFERCDDKAERMKKRGRSMFLYIIVRCPNLIKCRVKSGLS
jgi:hypothetical protein